MGGTGVSRVRDGLATGSLGADELRGALSALPACDEPVAIALALDLLAGEPRDKPSRRLVIDPQEHAIRRWSWRVAAASVLLASPAYSKVRQELLDELGDCVELAGDVLAATDPTAPGAVELRHQVGGRRPEECAVRPVPST